MLKLLLKKENDSAPVLDIPEIKKPGIIPGIGVHE